MTAKQALLQFIQENNRLPSKKNPEEVRLFYRMEMFCRHGHSEFDQAVCEVCYALGYKRPRSSCRQNKQAILDFFHKNKRLPAQNVPEEHRLWRRYKAYAFPSSAQFDPAFREAVIELRKSS